MVGEKMRRKNREMSKEFGMKVIDKARYGVISMVGESNKPYGIPLSIVRDVDILYFHSAKDGKKVKLLERNTNVSVAFVGQTEIPENYTEDELNEIIKDEFKTKLLISNVFTTEFESVIVTGQVKPVKDEDEKIKAMRLICEKYTPTKMDYFPMAIKAGLERVNVYGIEIEEITAKRKKYDENKKELKYGRIKNTKDGVDMENIVPDRKQAYKLLTKYNKSESLINHALAVEAVMVHFAELFEEDDEKWGVIGLIHDLDYEMYPEEHCKKTEEILIEENWPEDYIRAVVSHGWKICTDVKPIERMEKVLYTIDELTGLIAANALMRPTGMEGMKVKSVKKKWKDKSFAAGVNREVIAEGAEMLGMDLNDVMAETIKAIQKVAEEIGLSK